MSQTKNLIALLLNLSLLSTAFADLPKWSYDAGPDPKTKMGKELIDITASIPNMPEISQKIIGRKQKFRPAFGPIPWRMLQEQNKVKMLFIGQDGTHIAEAAGRPATAGFGGRAQDLANYFGVNEGAAFINTYAFTIKGQYGVYNTPYIFEKNGKQTARFSNYVSNELWAITQSLKSPITKWRNNLIDWIIRNNKDSMKLIVLFGGAAKDAIATYARSKGAKVEAFIQKDIKKIQMPLTKGQYAGGNNTAPGLVAKNGKDVLALDFKRRLDSAKEAGDEVAVKRLTKLYNKGSLDYSKSTVQKEFSKLLKERLTDALPDMVFTKGGKNKNGMLNAAQLGGFDLGKMSFNGIRTRSLRGITLDDGTVLDSDVMVVALPHPSSLSRTVMDHKDGYEAGKKAASARVMKNITTLKKALKKLPQGDEWNIEADPGKVNFFAKGDNYNYGRSDIGPEFYDFGTPKNRMVSKSTARRMGGNANVVIIGTRENGNFDKKLIDKMKFAKPAFGINPENLFIARPSATADRYTFDPGPGKKFAKLMKQNLNLKTVFAPKPGKSFDNDGIKAFNIKSHPSVADFGHYRGTFKNPKVLVIADPHGYDDLVTARALTGERGQYLHGLMQDLEINNNYLVLKTVPFAMDGASDTEWETVYNQTKNYRKAVIKELLKQGSIEVVLTDGANAKKAADELLKGSGVPVVNTGLTTRSKASGLANAKTVKAINKALGTNNKASGAISNIPRAHLSFYSRTWEGTSGDRVITSRDSRSTFFKGLAFAESVPAWAYNQKQALSKFVGDDTQDLVDLLEESGLPLPYEKIPAFLRRVDTEASLKFEVENFEDFYQEAM